MENNQNTKPINPVQNTESVAPDLTATKLPPTAPVEPQVPVTPQLEKPNPMENLKTKFNNFPKNTKILIIVVSVLFLIILILSILVAMFGKKQNVITITPSPSPISVTPAPNVILNASRYATDSGVLKIEGDLNNFQKQLETTDVKQGDLTVPSINFNINFNQ